MQPPKFEELGDRAALLANAEERDAIRKAETRSIIARQIEAMKEEGKALELTEEEERMLWAFRRFKLRMRKQGEVFNWQTRMPEGVQLAEETAEIIHPSEA